MPHENKVDIWPKVIDLTKFIDTVLLMQLQMKLDSYIKENPDAQIAYILLTIKQRKFLLRLKNTKLRQGNGVDEPDLLFGIPCSYVFKQKRGA